MQSPWDNIDSDAYAPMMDETISIKTTDGKTTSLRCAVFSLGMGDPLSEDMLDTEREDITLVFSKCDWPFIQTLKRGATITRPMYSKTYSISESKLDECLGWTVTARSR